MGNKLGGQKSTKSKEDKKREQDDKKQKKKEQKARKKSSKKTKKLARGGFQNSGSEFDTDLESSHFTGADSESGVFHSAENLSTSPYLDSCTRSERENSGMWPASSGASRHPQVLSSRDFRDGFSLEACIPPEIARPVTHYTDTTSSTCGGGGGGGAGVGSSGDSNTMSYRCYNNSSGSLKSKRSNSAKSQGPSRHHTPTSTRYQRDDVMSGSTSSSQKSGHTGTGGYCTPLLNTPVFGRVSRSVSPHQGGPGLSRVHEPDRDSMDIVPLPYSPFDSETKVFTTYNPTIIHKDQQGQLHHQSYFHQPIDYKNLPKPTSPHPQRRAFSPKMTTAPFRIISSDESSSSPTTPIPQRKAAALLSDLFRSSKKKKHNSASEDEEKPSFLQRLEKKSEEQNKEDTKPKGKKIPVWKTWERSNKRKSSSREGKLSIFGTSRKTGKNKAGKGDGGGKESKKDRSSDSTLQDFRMDVDDVNDDITASKADETKSKQSTASASACKTTKSSTSSFENSLNSKGPSDYDFSAEKNRNSSPPVAKSAAFCIMRLEELERNIEKTIKEKFPDAESFLLRKTPPEEESRGSKSLPTTPSLKKKLYINRDLDLSSDEAMSSDLLKLSSRLDELKGATRYYDETFEESSSPAKSPVVLRRFGMRTRHASISPKIQRAKTAAIYNSPSEMERLMECKKDNGSIHKSGSKKSPARDKTDQSLLLRDRNIGVPSEEMGVPSSSSIATAALAKEEADKAIIKARLKSYSRPLVRQQRVEEPDKGMNVTHERPHQVTSREEEKVIASAATAVFGSVSPKLKRHMKEKQEKGRSELDKENGMRKFETVNVRQKAGEMGSGEKESKTKRRSGSLDSLMESLRGSSSTNSRPLPGARDKQSAECNPIKPAVQLPTDKLTLQTAPSVSVRSRVRSINKSLSEEAASVQSSRKRSGSGEDGGLQPHSQPSSPTSNYYRIDTRQNLGDSREERINWSNASLGISPTPPRKHSADHVVFGTAVALPCRVYASATDSSKGKPTSPPLSRDRGGTSLSPSELTHHRQDSINEKRNPKNAFYQHEKKLETEAREKRRTNLSSEKTSHGNNGNTPVPSHGSECRSQGGSKLNGRDGQGVTRCVKDDEQLPVPGKGYRSANLRAGSKDRLLPRGDETGIVCGDKSVDLGSDESRSIRPSDGFIDVFQRRVDENNTLPDFETPQNSYGGRGVDGTNGDDVGSEGDYDNVIPWSRHGCFGNHTCPGKRTYTNGKERARFIDINGSHNRSPIRNHDSESSSTHPIKRDNNNIICDYQGRDQQEQHHSRHDHDRYHHQQHQQHHPHHHNYQQQQQQQQQDSEKGKGDVGDLCYSRIEEEQPVVVLKQPISQIISDMISVEKKQKQRLEEQQQQQLRDTNHPHHHQQQQLQQQQQQQQQSPPNTKDELVARDAVAMVSLPPPQPLSVSKGEEASIEPSRPFTRTLSIDECRTNKPEDECLPDGGAYSPDTQKELMITSSEGTGDSDIDSFVQAMRESVEKSAAFGAKAGAIGGEGGGGETARQGDDQQPPPPSPNALDKLIAEFAEEDEDEEEEVYEERMRLEAGSRQVNLALTRQNEMKEFTEKIMNRLSDLLGSQSGNELTVDDDRDEVFIDETKEKPLLEGAPYRVMVEEEVVDDLDTDSHDLLEDEKAAVYGDPLLTDFILSSSTKDPIPVERINPSRFSTSSSLSTSSSSSSSSSGLFAPPPPASSSKRNPDGSEGLPTTAPHPDFFVFPETADVQEHDQSQAQDGVYWSRSAHTRSYHSDDDVARGGGIPEYYDDKPLWNKRQKPPGQISAKMASIRRRERRERWLKKRRRNRTDLISTCSSEVGSERSQNHSRLSLDDFEEDEEVAKLSSQRGAMGSGILTSPKYTKPIMPFLMGGEDVKRPVEETFTSRTVGLESSVSCRFGGADGGVDSYRKDKQEEEGEEGNDIRAEGGRDGDGHLGMKIPGLEETFDELISVQQILDGLQERTPASGAGATHSITAPQSEPRPKCMPLTAENIRSMKDQFRDNNNGRQSRLSNTNRTESDLDIYSEYRDDASTDSNLYADDEDDDDANDPYTTADDDLSDGTGDTADIDNFVVSCTFYNSSAFPQPENPSHEASYDHGTLPVPGATGAATLTTSSTDANRLSTPLSSVRNSTEDDLRDWRAGTNIITNSNLRQNVEDPMNRSFTAATTTTTTPGIGIGSTNPDTTTRDAVFMRSNSAPGSYTGSQLSTARDPAMAAINSDEEFWAGRATFERSYQQLETAAGEVSSTFQNAREQMMDIQHHLQALRRQMEGLQDELTSTSYTLTPEFSADDSK